MQESLARGEIAEILQSSPTSGGRDTGQLPEKSSDVLKVVVGIPLKGHTPPLSYHDRMLMWKYLGHREEDDFHRGVKPRYCFSLNCTGEVLVPFARDMMAKQVLAQDADYLFMIDDDMLAPPDLFFKLAANDKDICAALAFTRNPDHKPVIYDAIEGYDKVTGQHYHTTKFAMNYPRDTLVECDAVGFGAVLIKRKVIEALSQARDPMFMGLAGTGEDITFCIKARKLGFSVWMDTRIKLGHLSEPKIITEDYADAHMKLSPEERYRFYGKYSRYQSMDLG